MEISEREYLELKQQITSLQSVVATLQCVKKPITSICNLLNEKVISGVHAPNHEKPVFEYRSLNPDAWTYGFMNLAKYIHVPSPTFHLEMRNEYGRRISPFICMDLHNVKAPRMLRDLTPEQIDISVQMLNEMIPIYNKYFKMNHQRVLYDSTGRGDYESIGVMDDGIIR